MSENKVIPHLTNLWRILEDEQKLRDLLTFVGEEGSQKDAVIGKLYELMEGKLARSTSERYVGSLATYHFLWRDEKDNEILELSNISKSYLGGELDYPDYVLTCMSKNIEWAEFLPDLYGVIQKDGPLSRTQILEGLRKLGYSVEDKDKRYLGEILPILHFANVIGYQDKDITVGMRTADKIRFFSTTNQRELVRLLSLAERRRVPIPTLRRLYATAVKTYLPSRTNRAEIQNTQEEIDRFREKEILREAESADNPIESLWVLKGELRSWQKEFLDKWMVTKRGIAKVVTGAGKTHLALAVMQNMKKEHPDLKVTIIVPTIVLLDQWYDALVDTLQISPTEIGLRGGGHRDDFNGKNVLVVVINSAISDNFIGSATQYLDNNLLIVDECHRAGAPKFREIFSTRRSWSLGLSATPEREADDAFEEVLVKELGEVIGTYSYADGLRDGIIPPFDILNYGVVLDNDEQAKYSQLTKEIQHALDRLKMRYPSLESGSVKLEMALRALQKKHPEDRDILLYFQKTKERKDEVIYPSNNRRKIVRLVLSKVLGEDGGTSPFGTDSPLNCISPKDKVIIFHEKIDEVNSLYRDLGSKEVSIYHSGFPEVINRVGLRLYKAGQTRVLLSVRSLIEGVNIPMTSLGIIMASSSSQTQRIQSLGRVLRKAEGKENTKLLIIYVKGTTDERIYYKGIDWERIVGKGRLEFRLWSEFGEMPIDPPQKRARVETLHQDVDVTTLAVGDAYPGPYEGDAYSFSHMGRLFKKVDGVRKDIPGDYSELWNAFRQYKPGGGRVTVNSQGHVLVKVVKDGRWKTIYLGTFPGSNSEPISDINRLRSEIFE